MNIQTIRYDERVTKQANRILTSLNISPNVNDNTRMFLLNTIQANPNQSDAQIISKLTEFRRTGGSPLSPPAGGTGGGSGTSGGGSGTSGGSGASGSPPSDQTQQAGMTPEEVNAACEKARILHKTDPERANFIIKLLALPLTLPGEVLKQIDAKTKNLLLTLFYKESQKMMASGGSSQSSGGSGGVVGQATGAVTKAVSGALDSAAMNIKQVLLPVSWATGTVLANATKIIQDPLGTVASVPGSIGAILDRINPGIVDRMELASKQLGLEAIKHFPAQVAGSLKQITSTAKTVLCLPISLIGNLEKALAQVSQALNQMIDKISAKVVEFIFGPNGVLDGIFPMAQLTQFLKAVQEISMTANAIATLTGGSIPFASALSQLQSFSSLANNAFRNPLSLASSFAPPGVSRALGAIRNPNQLLQQLVPPKISQGLNMLNNFCNSTTTGNLGFLFASLLGPAKAQALQYLFQKYVAQSSLLAPQLNERDPSGLQNQINEDYTPQTENDIITRTADRSFKSNQDTQTNIQAGTSNQTPFNVRASGSPTPSGFNFSSSSPKPTPPSFRTGVSEQQLTSPTPVDKVTKSVSPQDTVRPSLQPKKDNSDIPLPNRDPIFPGLDSLFPPPK